MRRDAFTLIEAVVASAIGALVLGAMFSMFYASRRMTDVGDLAHALAEASIAMEQMHRDLTQAVKHPDPAVKAVVLISQEGAAQFIHSGRDKDGKLTGKLVVYRREKTAQGNWRMMRKLGDVEAPLPGVYSSIRMFYYEVGSTPFVRVTLHVVARDQAQNRPRGGADEALLTSLVHVTGPEMLDTPFFDWKALDGLKSVEMLKGQLGF
jgi:type II secretory pathway pseudopilin PulG